MTTEPITEAGRATVLRRAMQNGVDLMDERAMAVISADVLAIEEQAGDEAARKERERIAGEIDHMERKRAASEIVRLGIALDRVEKGIATRYPGPTETSRRKAEMLVAALREMEVTDTGEVERPPAEDVWLRDRRIESGTDTGEGSAS